MTRAIEYEMEKSGIQMTKLISSGGIFSYDVYDNRAVYTIDELNKLDSEGFTVNIDMGVFLFNALVNYKSDKKDM